MRKTYDNLRISSKINKKTDKVEHLDVHIPMDSYNLFQAIKVLQSIHKEMTRG